ncbi:MAG: ATP phosphoribosyltransferase regulatory subunit, partial [Deltaproteobacteria bacterium]
EGRPRDQWTLRSPAELLDLKVCDPAMGSGAFLVQVCRYLSERLVEAWGLAEEDGRVVGMDGLVHTPEEAVEPIPKDEDERLVIARRLVAERCIYGVDVNPLAVELAKLSIWLVTLSKGRPLEFLDHNLRCGDSLLGIRDLDQLLFLDLNPGRGAHRPLFAQNIAQAVEESLEWRRTIRATPIRDVRDVRDVSEMEEESRRVVEAPRIVADALVGLALASGGDERKARPAWKDISIDVGRFLSGDDEAGRRIARLARKMLDTDLPAAKPPRRPFHWPLEFPEVFQRENGGFDAIVGNPPFMGGQRISGAFGKVYREYLVRYLAEGNKGSADLVAYFYLRAFDLLRQGGDFGLLAVNTIAEGDTRQVGLERLVGEKGAVIYAAYPNEPWPGKAAVVTSRVHVRKGEWRNAATLSGR